MTTDPVGHLLAYAVRVERYDFVISNEDVPREAQRRTQRRSRVDEAFDRYFIEKLREVLNQDAFVLVDYGYYKVVPSAEKPLLFQTIRDILACHTASPEKRVTDLAHVLLCPEAAARRIIAKQGPDAFALPGSSTVRAGRASPKGFFFLPYESQQRGYAEKNHWPGMPFSCYPYILFLETATSGYSNTLYLESKVTKDVWLQTLRAGGSLYYGQGQGAVLNDDCVLYLGGADTQVLAPQDVRDSGAQLPGSLIYCFSSQSYANGSLQRAFASIGASAYVGWTGSAPVRPAWADRVDGIFWGRLLNGGTLDSAVRSGDWPTRVDGEESTLAFWGDSGKTIDGGRLDTFSPSELLSWRDRERLRVSDALTMAQQHTAAALQIGSEDERREALKSLNDLWYLAKVYPDRGELAQESTNLCIRLRQQRTSLNAHAVVKVSAAEDNTLMTGHKYSLEAGIQVDEIREFVASPVLVEAEAADTPIGFLVVARSDNIAIRRWQRNLRFYPTETRPQLVRFVLCPTVLGTSHVSVDFYYQRRWLTTVDLTLTVSEALGTVEKGERGS